MPEPTIGCIGWGSLLWDPRSLPMAGPFRADGPRLPIEFSRVAKDGRVTLVIDPAADAMATWWCPMAVDTIAEAIEGLGRRERIGPARWSEWIGWQIRDGAEIGGEGGARAGGLADPSTRATFAEWLVSKDVDAVVWTALPARTPDERFAWPTTEALVAHVRGLEGEARARAEEYIRRAPTTIDSRRRRLFESEFGWTPSDAPPNAPTPGREKEPV